MRDFGEDRDYAMDLLAERAARAAVDHYVRQIEAENRLLRVRLAAVLLALSWLVIYTLWRAFA